MKIYNFIGYSIIVLYMMACMYCAPTSLGPWLGLLVGIIYFLACWFMAGLYLADILHMGIAHKALDYKVWFMKAVTHVNNTFGLYVGPISWVNRHRLHHKYSDHAGDPNKLADDGFWKTLYLCILPYPTKENISHDKVLKDWSFRIWENLWFAVPIQIASFYLVWYLTGSFAYTFVMWAGMRIFALWVNMIQNYWTHTRVFGYRRYDDQDNAMNIGEWFPVTATFSACLQNNHHHYPGLLRLSHEDSEYDFGFLTVKFMKALGLVEASQKGTVIPKDVKTALPNW